MGDILGTQNDSSEQQELQDLRDFIDSNPEPREQKRALAVMRLKLGHKGSKGYLSPEDRLDIQIAFRLSRGLFS